MRRAQTNENENDSQSHGCRQNIPVQLHTIQNELT